MLKAWIAALRLKTLPLALGAIIIGSWLPELALKIEIFGWAALTAILLQILSNLANDYGDYAKGTDLHREDRQLAGGKISPRAMKIAIILFIVLSLASGLELLYVAFGNQWNYWLIFLGFGLASIIAAIAYTVGKKAYGYYGLGDLFVFLFFGLLAVAGTAFLYDQTLDVSYWLPSIAYGTLCVGVLNINNIRDLDKDILSNKITLASKLGKDGAINYQGFLYLTSILTMSAHHLTTSYFSLAPLGILVLAWSSITALRKAETAADYNNQLRNLSLGSLGISILFILELHL